ncbi:hypothetical protein [Rhodomicrobium sp.]|uniref:hypothetical protein n=1 Tax=Rhodomicrobium sp. TaxID=2720632 RepID=UPI0039E2EC95
MGIVGFGFGGEGQNVGVAFVRLKDFEKRKSKDFSAASVAGRAMMAFSRIAGPESKLAPYRLAFAQHGT